MPKDRRARGLIAASCVLIASAGLGCEEKKPPPAAEGGLGSVSTATQPTTKAPPPPKGVKVGGQKVEPQ